ncbi:MAG: hypothetical protein EBW42_16180, partial [Rhodobacterales bacterium]|nr:hypothetical protein [Rhodobacterales bacterium]
QGLLFSGRVKLALPGAAIGSGPGSGPGGVVPPPESVLQAVINKVRSVRMRVVWYLFMTLLIL